MLAEILAENNIPHYDPTKDVDGSGRTNELRAARGKEAATAYSESENHGGPPLYDCCVIRDCICDLLHYAHQQGWDPMEEAAFGIDCFVDEVTTQNEQ